MRGIGRTTGRTGQSKSLSSSDCTEPASSEISIMSREGVLEMDEMRRDWR